MTVVDLRAYVGDVPAVPEVLAALADAGGRGRAQLLDGALVAGPDHLRAASAAATRATSNGSAATSDLGLETLRRASGERQIGKAIAFLGLKPGASRVVAAVLFDAAGAAAVDAVASKLAWRRDDALLEPDAREGGVESLLRLWNVGEVERAAVPKTLWKDLVLERAALTDAWK